MAALAAMPSALPDEVWAAVASFCDLPECSALATIPQARPAAVARIHAVESSPGHLQAKSEALARPWASAAYLMRVAPDSLNSALVQQLHAQVMAAAAHVPSAVPHIAAQPTSASLSTRSSFRAGAVAIAGCDHQPPPASHVPALVEQLCRALRQRITAGQDRASDLIGLAFWRLTWIHPFYDGNGRVAALFAWHVARAWQCQQQGGTFDSAKWQQGLWKPVAVALGMTELVKHFGTAHMARRRAWLPALRAMDTVWSSASPAERRAMWNVQVRYSASLTQPGPRPVLPAWKAVGLAVLRDTWFWLVSNARDLMHTESTVAYRWTNYFDGDCYSTGITSTAGHDTTPTIIGTSQAYQLDERALLELGEAIRQGE